MEPTTPPQTVQPEPYTPTPQVSPPPKSQPNKLNILLVAMIIVLVAAVAYMLATRTMKSQSENVTPSPSPVSANNAPTATAITPTATSEAEWTKYTSTKLKDLSFPAYSIQYPSTWIPEKNNTSVSETYMLNNGDYQIMIYQAPVEGSSCVFSGEMPNNPAQDLRAVKYTDVKTTSGLMLRRYPSPTVKPAGTAMDFCATTNGTDWGMPTQVGAITYKVPVGYAAEKLVEMDNIIKTLQEVK